MKLLCQLDPDQLQSISNWALKQLITYEYEERAEHKWILCVSDVSPLVDGFPEHLSSQENCTKSVRADSLQSPMSNGAETHWEFVSQVDFSHTKESLSKLKAKGRISLWSHCVIGTFQK